MIVYYPWLIGLIVFVAACRLTVWLWRLGRRRRAGIAQVDRMDGEAFEHFAAYLLRQNGASNVRVTPYQGDQGIDITFSRDDQRWGVQCKRYSSAVGNHAVQEAIAGQVFYHLDHVMVMTNSHYTQAARALARAGGVVLYDRERLIQFILTAKQNSKERSPAS